LEGSDCADGGVCEATTLNCVRTCQEDNQCSNNVCNQALGLCEECHDASGCQAEPDEPFCQLNRLHCVECVGDTQCGAAEPRCDFRDGHCVECLRQEDCPLAEPVCDIGARICRPSPP
jgi:hypothetical protein